MAWAILDTNVYIDHWEDGLHGEALSAIRKRFVIRHSAVVLSELRRGARTPKARKLVADLFRLASIRWEPTAYDWWEAGRIICKVGHEKGWDRRKRRDIQNDVLIALTARRHGATVVTDDLSDFEVLSKELDFSFFPLRR